jgi:signal transduction histidine kinase/ActR/RegA family two-component response regulator
MRNPLNLNHTPLRLILLVPFLLQIFLAVGLTGYLSLLSGQKAVNELANRLQTEVGDRVTQHLDSYLETPNAINEVNMQAIRIGLMQLNDFEKAGKFFWQQMRSFPVGYINFGGTDGLFLGVERQDDDSIHVVEDPSTVSTRDHIYETDAQGNRTKLIQITEEGADHRNEEWYTDPLKLRKPVWSQIYQWEDKPEILSISSSYPVYTQNGQPVGVVGVDLILSQISEKLRRLKLGASGKIFIMEKDGLLVASSSQAPSIKVAQQQASRIKAVESEDPFVRGAAQYLQTKFSDYSQIQSAQNFTYKLGQEQQFVRIAPWRDQMGLSWLVVLTVPESDFTAQISANTRNTLVLCAVALAVATVLGIHTSQWISRPIARMSKAAEAIAMGQFDQSVQAEGARELKTLAFSFNRMAQQLRESFTALAQTNTNLETQVEERTAQFKKAVRAAMKATGQSATAVQAQEEAKAEAAAAKRSQEQFFATLSQELRGPLTSILGYANLLTHDPDLSLAQATGAKTIHNSGTRLLALIDNLLDYAALSEHRVELELTDIDLPAFLREVCSPFEMLAHAKNVLFQVDIDPTLPSIVIADGKRLRQVLLNLLDNAVKFTDQGSIQFKVSTSDQRTESAEIDSEHSAEFLPTQQIRFQIMDTGIGISSVQLNHLFEPLQAVDNFSEAPRGGKRLGLTISQKIIELMGGDLQVHSQLDRGSNVWFEIPLAIVESAAKALPEISNPIRGYIGKKRSILIVEDQPETAAYLQRLLTPLGFNVVSAENGNQGLTLTRQLQPDLILTNILMKGKTGLRMTMEIREMLDIKQMPIIALSASNLERIEEASLRAGCTACLLEPIDEQRLFALLAEHLALQWIYLDRATV